MPKRFEYRYKVMFENMAQGAFFQQADGSLVDVNPAALAMFGLTRDEYLNRTSYNRQWQVIKEDGSRLPPEDYPSIVALRTGQPVHNFVLGVFIPKKKSYIWININAIPLFGKDENPEQVFVTLDDISEQKRLDDIDGARNHLILFATNHPFEELLVETTNELARLTDSKIACFYFCSDRGETIELKACSSRTSPTPASGKETVQAHTQNKTRALTECMQTGKPVVLNDYKSLDQGEKQTFIKRELAIPILRQNRIVAILSVGDKRHNYNKNDIETAKLFADLAWDTAERKRIEQLIINSQQQLRFLADQVPVLIAQLDQRCHYKFVNKPYARFFGFHPSEVIGKQLRELIGDKAYEATTPHIKTVLSGKTDEFEIELLTRQTQGLTFQARYAPEIDEQGNVVGFIAAFMDISSRKQIESELLRKQHYLKKAQELGKIGTWELDIINDNLIWTDENCRIFGVPEGSRADYQVFLSRVHPDDRDYVNRKWEAAMEGKPYDIEHRLLIDGKVTWVREKADVTFAPDGQAISAIGFTQEITERILAEQAKKQLEEDLQHAHKLEALGTMAGGIAHNFNNNLAIILGNTEMAKLKSSGQEEIEKYLGNAHQAILRSRDLIKQILIYSRQDIGDKKAIKIASIIDDTFSLLKSAYPATVNLQLHFPAPMRSILISADKTRIEEALINLCNNAVQSMNEQGKLDIALARVDIEEEQIPKTYQCQAGAYVRISIRDTGCGIPDDMIEKIFDPFFTTKEVNEGTGMGLSTVRGIVDFHNGFITVDSKVDVGTTFDLYLPIEDEAVTEADSPQGHLEGSGTILFIDDEEMLAELGKVMLEEMGYQVTSLTDPREALKKITEDPNLFDLVITDQTMPHLTGKELAQQITQIRPDLPIILCTGHSSHIIADSSVDLGIAAFCLKPLRMNELGKNVRRCLSPRR